VSRPLSLRYVFDAVRRAGPLRAQELAAQVPAAGQTVRDARRELEDAELLELGPDGYRLGPATTVLAFSIAREGVRCAVVDGHGARRASQHKEVLVLPMRHSDGHPRLSPEGLADVLVELANACLAETGCPTPRGIAMAWPGQIEFERDGRSGAYERRESGFYDGLRFDELLRQVQDRLELTDLDQTLVNDADAEFLAERRWGVAVAAQNVLGIKLAGGIGSSLVIDGRVYEGSTGTVGEIGHLDVSIEGILDKPRDDVLLQLAELDYCSCGSGAAHLERYASGRAIVERLIAPEALADGYEQAVRELRDSSPALQHVMRQAGVLVGQALAGPALLLEPDAIVVSSFPRAQVIGTAIELELHTRLDKHIPVLLGSGPEADGPWMPVLGAAAQAQDRYLFPKADAFIQTSASAAG
jgi:predicted NBD/HSP70 family sugar kinase